MHRNESTTIKRPVDAEDSFPWKCAHCGKQEVAETTIDYEVEVRHDGRVHEFTVHDLRIPICHACGEKVFTGEVDRQINAALPSHGASD